MSPYVHTTAAQLSVSLNNEITIANAIPKHIQASQTHYIYATVKGSSIPELHLLGQAKFSTNSTKKGYCFSSAY